MDATHPPPGKYIYGIIDATPHPVTTKRYGEISGCGVYTIPYQDISAVVSDSEIVDYTHMPKDVLARLLVNHQKVVERTMNFGSPVIPIKLGTFAADETEVKNILHKGYSLIKYIFGRINDKIEIDLVATWSDFNSVLKAIGEKKEIKEFKEKLSANPKAVTVDDRMRAGVMVKKALDKKREKYAFQIQSALKSLSEDSRVHEVMDDKMVVNTAFLVSKPTQKDFDRKVEELNSEFNERLNFRCVGPLPPYSFYTLEVKKLKYEEIDWAREKLALSDFTSKAKIKKAYQAKALSSHPDRNLGTSGVEKEFDDVIKAYKLLIDYCQACEQAGQKDRYSFEKEEFGRNSLIVRVRE